jgi:phosphomannomutase/phosphoglucomutase
VPSYFSTPELRVDCADDRKFALVQAASEHFRATHDVIDVDGARVLFGDGWGLIRASNTQPIVVLRFEALTAARRDAIHAEFNAWMRTQGIAV